MNKLTKMYKLVWIVNKVVKETILQNVHYPIAKWKLNELKNTTHTTGLLLIQPM